MLHVTLVCYCGSDPTASFRENGCSMVATINVAFAFCKPIYIVAPVLHQIHQVGQNLCETLS